MPPWVACAPRLTSALNGRTYSHLHTACRYRLTSSPRVLNLRVRSASTRVSPTAINLRPDIPPRNKELHDALSALSGVAESYVNSDRLALALSGVAARESVTRVAVLALGSQLSAQRLAKLLLADPLGNEEAWEKELEKRGDGSEKAVLLKFGDPTDAQTPNPLYKTLAIPSRVLKNNKLEILVSTLNTNIPRTTPDTTDSSEDSMLVPKLQAASAQGLPVPFAVHKTLVIGDGLDSAVAFGRFTSDNVEGLPTGVKLAINLPPASQDAFQTGKSESVPINIDEGSKAIATFRESIQNSVAYERGWYESGLPTLSSWLLQDLHPSQPIKPITKSLISSLTNAIEANVTREDTQRLQALASVPSANTTSASITAHLESWAENSHTGLRDDLDDAFSSRAWHKLSWYKLLWRVDDISMISSEILERKWLTSAEKSSIFLAGRMKQAGFPDDITTTATPTLSPAIDVPETTNETAPTAENPGLEISTQVKEKTPWFNHIPTSRTDLINSTIPPLQALAQRLLLQTFSTTSLSSAASALLYVTMSSLSVFEASAIGVLGLTFSLRRMQRVWEDAREQWQGLVREQGRRTLKESEELVRGIIRVKEREGLGRVGSEESVKEGMAAREAVARVRRALEKLEKEKDGR